MVARDPDLKGRTRSEKGSCRMSDYREQGTYPPVPWPEDAIVRGEVMWTGKMLRGSR